ncbi:CBS domain-containing protein [Streptomyces chattanoogensis]|uniref:CBS domain-containing protein n=1 Tax=Streptomyces chattanoogensis TaxID=66876 RepID=UPI003695A7EC
MGRTPHIVSDVMTQTVVAVGRDARFKEIVETMEQWKVSALPVLEGEGRVIGVVSEADLLPKEEFRESDPDRLEQLRRLDDTRKAGALTAGELMTTPAFTVHADATLAQAARTMAHASVKRLPVVDATGMLQGIVSRADLLKVFLRPDEELAEEIRTDIVRHLFAGSHEDVQVTVVDGVATLSGHFHNSSLIPLVARLVRAVEGVVDVTFDVTAPTPVGTRPANAPSPEAGADSAGRV